MSQLLWACTDSQPVGCRVKVVPGLLWKCNDAPAQPVAVPASVQRCPWAMQLPGNTVTRSEKLIKCIPEERAVASRGRRGVLAAEETRVSW